MLVWLLVERGRRPGAVNCRAAKLPGAPRRRVGRGIEATQDCPYDGCDDGLIGWGSDPVYPPRMEGTNRLARGRGGRIVFAGYRLRRWERGAD